MAGNKEGSEWRISTTGDIQPNGVSLVQIRLRMSSIYQCQQRRQSQDRKTYILIENNEIKPLECDIFKWALYLQGWRDTRLPTFKSENTS